MSENSMRCLCHFMSPCPKTVGGLLTIEVDEKLSEREEEERCFFSLSEGECASSGKDR
jgi:hypothetical protein